MYLRWDKVSHKRINLQDDSKWPSPCMPYGYGSIGQTWTILKSGIGWLLILVEPRTEMVITYV